MISVSSIISLITKMNVNRHTPETQDFLNKTAWAVWRTVSEVEKYSTPCQTSMVESSRKNSSQLRVVTNFIKKARSHIFDRVWNTPVKRFLKCIFSKYELWRVTFFHSKTTSYINLRELLLKHLVALTHYKNQRVLKINNIVIATFWACSVDYTLLTLLLIPWYPFSAFHENLLRQHITH